MINNQIAFKCMNTCKNQVKLVLQRFFTLNLNLQKQKQNVLLKVGTHF